MTEAEGARALFKQVADRVDERLFGVREPLGLVMVGILTGNHVLIDDVPGVGKTTLVRMLSTLLGLRFQRVQFTPDLMPSDITGTSVLNLKTNDFEFRPGPLFTQVLLADEINRATPKTQAALLEAMQEHAVTTAGKTHRLPEPFIVLATQNPIEQEGTYPLPEAQLDRFMVQLTVGYPSREEEERIVAETTTDDSVDVRPVLTAAQLSELLHLVRRLPAAPSVVSYAVKLARSTRPDSPEAPANVKKYVSWGAGPRASQYLILGAKARAAMDGRAMPDLEDVQAMALPVLSHRVVVNFQAEAEGVTAARVVAGRRAPRRSAPYGSSIRRPAPARARRLRTARARPAGRWRTNRSRPPTGSS